MNRRAVAVQQVLPFSPVPAAVAPVVTSAVEQPETAVIETPVDRVALKRRPGTDWDEIASILGYSRAEVDRMLNKMRSVLAPASGEVSHV